MEKSYLKIELADNRDLPHKNSIGTHGLFNLFLLLFLQKNALIAECFLLYSGVVTMV